MVCAVKAHLRVKAVFLVFPPLCSLFDIYLLSSCDQTCDVTGQKAALAAVSGCQGPTCCNSRCEMKVCVCVCFGANKPLNLRRECRAVGDVRSSWPTSGGETCIQPVGLEQKLVGFYSQAGDVDTMTDQSHQHDVIEDQTYLRLGRSNPAQPHHTLEAEAKTPPVFLGYVFEASVLLIWVMLPPFLAFQMELNVFSLWWWWWWWDGGKLFNFC